MRHCAYGQPNFGENPKTDAQEVFALLILDKPIHELIGETNGTLECIRNITMIQIATDPDRTDVPPMRDLVGKRVRVRVNEFFMALTGHHHTRFIMSLKGVEVLGPAPMRSLRGTWSKHEHDFLGTSCPGFP